MIVCSVHKASAGENLKLVLQSTGISAGWRVFGVRCSELKATLVENSHVL